MDLDQLKKRLDFYLRIATGLAKFTPTDVDNKIAGILSSLVKESWFIELVAYLLDQLSHKKSITIGEMMNVVNRFKEGEMGTKKVLYTCRGKRKK